MRLSKAEKEYLHMVLDHLTDTTGYYETTGEERKNITYPLFKKFREELTGV